MDEWVSLGPMDELEFDSSGSLERVFLGHAHNTIECSGSREE